MTVRIAADAIHLEGRCLVEDAETLLVALQQSPALAVDVACVQRLHLAVVQVLLALRPRLRGRPHDQFLSRYILAFSDLE